MAAVLGISAHYHDAAAALVVDGASSRRSRKSASRASRTTPRCRIARPRACLALAGLDAGDARRGGLLREPVREARARARRRCCATFPRSWRQFPRALGGAARPQALGARPHRRVLGVARAQRQLRRASREPRRERVLRQPVRRRRGAHRRRRGREATTALWHGEGDVARAASAAIDFPHSLGLLYAALTAYLGFEVNEGEYKVMGLAAFGAPRFRDEFASVLHARRRRQLRARARATSPTRPTRELGFGPALEALLGPRRRPARRGISRRRRRSALRRRRGDAPAVTEDALLAPGRAARARAPAPTRSAWPAASRSTRVANARLAREAGFDAGVRAARRGRRRRRARRGAARRARARAIRGRAPLATAALGRAVRRRRRGRAGRARSASRAATRRRFRRATSPSCSPPARSSRCATAASSGARARSASARCSPRRAHRRSRERLNRVIKQREPFRPFAPAVRAERGGRLLRGRAERHDAVHDHGVPGPRRTARAALAAVTHVDGTARVQTVTAARRPLCAPVLDRAGPRDRRFRSCSTPRSTAPASRSSPAPTDALGFFLQHPVDAMVIGDVLIERERA